ncbi:FMN-dependent NADH-azoreductase [Stenotrophomonas indicatrix]|uniref:FMN-dependent NADH-azoreductase n=1 Tax=Stenotrophomonas indicatrix TaxID=2045451 RepID=UPI000C191D24|nr:FMN-dependent NADH-azoreductase [Stenotrophomonas indicatrix]PII15842.1 FMN-dependent NADH-azoreductase [Stenotrophomonas indicatrix]
MKFLHLDSSMLGAASVSRQISREIVDRLTQLHPGAEVVARDLASDPAFHLSSAHLAAFQGAQTDNRALTDDLVKGSDYIQELLEADVLVIGAPMYNLTIPTPLKAWIDRIAVAGKTFRYTETGPEGLLKGKRAFIASARGSIYNPGGPMAALEHQESYLLGLLAFLGITDVQVVRAEGTAYGAEAKEAALQQAQDAIAKIAA